jgi:hypothetical protein
MGCSMATEGYSGDYASLEEYAEEKGINTLYLRGAVYGIPLDLPTVGGAMIVPPESRAELDRVAARIKSAMRKPGRPARPKA